MSAAEEAESIVCDLVARGFVLQGRTIQLDKAMNRQRRRALARALKRRGALVEDVDLDAMLQLASAQPGGTA